MAYTQTEIANLAINYAEGRGISLFGSEETEEGVQVKRWYGYALDQVLRDIRPNFARTRAVLVQSPTVPSFEYAYSYELPTDFIYLLQLNGWSHGDYERYCEIEGTLLLTDEEEAKIRYIYRNETPAEYDALFVDALALKLAIKIAPRLAASPRLKQELTGEYYRARNLATLRSNQENRKLQKPRGVTSAWIQARVASTNG